MDQKVRLYTDLLMKSVTNAIYKDDIDLYAKRESREVPIGDAQRGIGAGWPSKAHSMVGEMRLRNLRDLAQRAIDEKIPGDFIETGVWRGGCCILMRGIIAINEIGDRKVWVCDSFEGLPPPDLDQYPKEEKMNFAVFQELAVSVEEVKRNFELYGFLDDQVKFVKGFFKDTLRHIESEKFALLRLDGDLYESTMDALVPLWPQLAPGGFVIVDDYHVIPACKDAVHDYLDAQGVKVEIHDIDNAVVWFQKPK